MKVFAHRGLLKQYPENSLPAVRAALNKGLAVEIDIRLNRDDDFVLLHDESLKRLFGADQNIHQVKTSHIGNYHFLNHFPKEPLILFEELCHFIGSINSYSLAIHLKLKEQTEKGLKLIVDCFGKFNLFNKSFIFGLTQQSAQKMKQLDGRIKIGFIVSDYRFDQTVYLWPEIKNMLNIFDIVWAAEFKNLYTQPFVDEVQSTGREIIAVSPELHLELEHPKAAAGYQKTWPDLIAWGVDGVCTDYPQEFIKYLPRIYE